MWAAWICQTMVSGGPSLPGGQVGTGAWSLGEKPSDDSCETQASSPGFSICRPGFDSDLLTLVPALGKNKSLKHLFLGKNFNVKAK